LECDGTLQSVIDNRSCVIQISTLESAPFLIVGGDSIYAKVVSVNTYGESEQSESGNGAYHTQVPHSPVSLQEN
jgi:hypothetical protein